jgi:prepilin-type N-terminal cleavage/methylation domain-containing protein
MRTVRTPRGARGFTLIEIMIVVAIIGIISSMAVPTFTLLTLRSKAAERHEVMLRIKKAVGDYYVQNGTTIPKGEALPLSGEETPAFPYTTSRRMPNWRTSGWVEVFRTSEEIMGSTYYSYSFACTEPTDGDPATLTIVAHGDLDGDGVPSEKLLEFQRINGVYQLSREEPEAGAEDQDTF